MRHIEELVTIMRWNGLPPGFVNTDYLTTNERAAFDYECQRQGVTTAAPPHRASTGARQ